MAGAIKGITIKFRGDTTSLDRALKDVKKEAKSTTNELKYIDKAIQFNPTSVDAWKQKQTVLNKAIGETKEKLTLMKQGLQEMESQGLNSENSEEFRRMQREIDQTERQLKGFQSELKSIGNVNLRAASEQFKQWGASLEKAGEAMKPLSAAGAAVTASIGAMAYKAGTAADDLNTLSKVTGISTEELQKYGLAADLVDVSTEAVAKAQQKLKKNLYQVGVYAKGPAEEFEMLGVAVTNADGSLRDSGEVFQDVIKALGEMTNETERDAIAQKLMGKSAAELNPLIEDGGETYERVAGIMKKYNLDYIDQETLDKANEFNDSLDTMKLMGKAALGQVASQLAGYLAPALEKAVDLFGRFADWVSKLDPRLLTLIAAIGGILAVLAPALILLGKISTGIGAIIKIIGVLGPAISGLALGPMAGIVAAITAVIAIGVLLYKNWDKIKAVAIAVGKKIKEVWVSVKTSVISTVNSLKTGLTTIWTNIKNTIISTVNGLKTGISSAWSTITTAIKNTAKKWYGIITSPYKKAWETIKSIIDKIKDFFPIDIGDFFGGIKLPHFEIEWSSVTAFGKTIKFPSGFDIDWYKTGGIFNSPSVIGVGEAGSEAVVPLDKFWDKLDNLAGAASAPVINIYPSPNQSAKEIAKEVERVLVQQQKQRSSAYGNI